MNAPVESVPVIQADRDAAAEALKSIAPSTGETGVWYRSRARMIQQGEADDHPFVQAFAQYRTNQVAELVEAMEGAADAIEGKIDDLDSAICCSGHECGCQGASNRQLLVYNLRALIASHKGEQP